MEKEEGFRRGERRERKRERGERFKGEGREDKLFLSECDNPSSGRTSLGEGQRWSDAGGGSDGLAAPPSPDLRQMFLVVVRGSSSRTARH